MKPRVLIDVDGPLTASFVEQSCAYLRKLGLNVFFEHATDWELAKALNLSDGHKKLLHRRIRQPGFAANFEPRRGALEFLNELREKAYVYAVTSPLTGSSTWAHEREEWLVRELGFKHRYVVSVRDKSLVSGHVLIDDKPDNLTTWRAAQGGRAILWEMPYNSTVTDFGPTIGNYLSLRKALEPTFADPLILPEKF